jgi:hypothetical protein
MYKKINNILGWLVFLAASVVYIITSEPTVSFWDCGEYIATAFKLQVGHPPGAPLFQLLGRFFSLFAFGNEALVARMVNTMSALSSSFTILFLFWSITMLARKLVAPGREPGKGEIIAIFGSALVGSLAYTFSDSFWFSAVEGEVYAMSSFFTALVFWAMLRWEAVADEPHSWRWLILIAYLIGLSIGVHLLNLLAIPAIAFIFYFRKYKATRKGIIITLITSVALLALALYGIIPWIVKLAGWFELFFVNVIGLPFDTGTVIYFLLLTAGIVLGLRWAVSKGKQVLYTALLAFTFLLIGYSSFFLLIIRSNANPPIDENNPENAIALLAYLNREQYGTTPLFKGPYFNAPVVDREDGKPLYIKDKVSGRYIVTDARKGTVPVYDPRFTTLFPRMWNNQSSSYERNYREWSQMKGRPITITSPGGGQETTYIPTFGENLRYFWRYQIDYMYFRYFMWNFAGRQNDRQGMGGPLDGNWVSGIDFIDQARLGPQDNLPESMGNKANNEFYLLPLLLGLAGLLFQWKRNGNDALIVGLLFLMTGLAIVVYLNQHAYQPRERDYAYAASFYAFSIWIGLGVLALWQGLKRFLSPTSAAAAATVLTLSVPALMASEGWDDHNRANRYTALEVAMNYLNSCQPNAILFTNGDNDTFPLWYAQEVEGIRTDVRVVNLSLLNTDWYVDQLKRKAYDSEAVPFSLTEEQYRQGTRDIVYFVERDDMKGYVDLRELFNVIHTQPERLQMQTQIGKVDYFPTRNFSIAVDSAKVVENGTVSAKDAGLIEPALRWTVSGGGVQKNNLMMLDLLAHFNWDRPVYFAITAGEEAYAGLTDYFQVEGLAYRLVPIRSQSSDGQFGRINTERMYDNLINRFRLDMSDPEVFMGNDHVRMAMNLRNTYGRLALELVKEGDVKRAREVCDRITQAIPDASIPFNFFMIPVAEAYYGCGGKQEADAIMSRLLDITTQDLRYYFRFPARFAQSLDDDKRQALSVLNSVAEVCKRNDSPELGKKAEEALQEYYGVYVGQPGVGLPANP